MAIRRAFSAAAKLDSDWSKLVKAELKGKDPSDLLWKTPEELTH
jgi:hypothetical protein